MTDLAATPRLARGVKTTYDETRRSHVVLFPEGVLVLNETAAAIVGLCDGRTTVAAITARLGERFDGVPARDVAGLVARLAARGVVETDG
ncbi:pyrroloquinoline quinone biosynthesis peptide chaperone PqqD [Saccharothrix algeriensis]|uniref:Pyrroloquinoline quinone biosynthesis peptide chaperone PqqD n=1 Tax=Saccharothrix algeriensis TaxID=173560 RepID=A0A8T8I3W5_9PSEU|nr:pyrroloquinoline quinone biosynthesis peptide chaperone PqqD [Saccharothrix algeriensis]MBM7811495.1 pyrroloquinoline quinone biosynthesis protein D [Saccharothrix algeriensis]QTR05321.1 pyrroloquinoline quinone biosynthesis peptide chaperone PqqD [Saccharothrix algeriensis]